MRTARKALARALGLPRDSWLGILFVLAGWVLTLVAVRGLFLNMGDLAPGDWDYFATLEEAVRKSILEHRQFPWWNPWMAGGMPLGPNPVVMLFSAATPLVLLFGVVPGLKLTLVLHFLIGFEGARRLASRFIDRPFFQIVVAVIFAWHGGQTTGGAVGQFGNMTIFYVPWLIYFALGLEDSWLNGVGLGVAEALMLGTNLHYNSVYGLLFTHLIIAMQLVRRKEARRQIVVNWLIASSLALGLAGFRLWLSWRYFSDYPRENELFIHVGWRTLVRMLMQPWQRPDMAPVMMRTQMGAGAGAEVVELPLPWWEVAAYVGVVPIVLFFVSLCKGVRWWHVFALLCLTFGFSSIAWWCPGTWLARLPVFRSMWMITRWRFPAILFLGLAVGTLLQAWSRSEDRKLRAAAWALGVFIVCDLFVSTFPGWGNTFFIEPERVRKPYPPARTIRSYQDPILTMPRRMRRQFEPYAMSSFMWWYVRDNLAVINAYDTILGYKRQRPTARRWVGHPEYIGEFAFEGEPLEPEFWSPNRVVLRVPGPGTLYLNQNPGRYWLVNGRRPWRDARVFEIMEQWEIETEEAGVVEVRVRPPSVWVGLMWSGLGFVLFAALVALRKKLVGEGAPATSSEPPPPRPEAS